MKVFIVVENYGLINQDAYIFADGDAAEQKYKEITGVDYKVAMRYFELEKEGDWDKLTKEIPENVISALDGEEWEQTKIYEIDFTLKGIQICEFESVHCPFCGGINLKERRKTTLNQHELDCLDCAGTFWIPCED